MVQKEIKPEKLTLAYLIKNDLPIWVRNATGDPGVSKEPGIMYIQVGHGDSRRSVPIFPGNDPICITDQISPESLKDCQNLFDLVHAKGLELLDPSKAEEYYEKNAERRKVVANKMRKHLTGAKETLPEKYKKEQHEIHPKVKDLCLKANHKMVPEQQFLETLYEIEKVLHVEDYKYLVTESQLEVIQEWAHERLQSLDPVEAAS